MQANMPANDNNENQELLNLIGDDAFTRLIKPFAQNPGMSSLTQA